MGPCTQSTQGVNVEMEYGRHLSTRLFGSLSQGAVGVGFVAKEQTWVQSDGSMAEEAIERTCVVEIYSLESGLAMKGTTQFA